jgi:tRNA(Ile)-lysidine synthase
MASSGKSKSSNLPGRISETLAPLVPEGSSILLGLSGGMDSVVLLHLLVLLAPRHSWKLSALHVHHGISPHAGKWAEFCVRLCEQYAVPMQVERVDISPLRDMGTEAAARKLRHEVLMRQPTDFVALAHHQGDQAETLLLQLLRGAGVKGAAAMPSLKHRKGAPDLLRPLLGISRVELLDYAEQNRLQWVDDESNADDSYPRNFLRHRVMPLLEERFPGCHATLARSARHFAEAGELLDELAMQDAQGAYDGVTLAVVRLTGLGLLRAKNLLYWFLRQRGALMPDHGRLEEMLRQLCMARNDAQICITWGEWEVRRYRGRVYVNYAWTEPMADLRITWNGEEVLALPQLHGKLHFVRCTGRGVAAEKMRSAPVAIRLRHGEERLRPVAARPARSLQYLFQEAGIPPWLRARWPLLYIGEKLAAVPAIAVDCAYRSEPGEPGLIVDWKAEMASDTGDKA